MTYIIKDIVVTLDTNLLFLLNKRLVALSLVNIYCLHGVCKHRLFAWGDYLDWLECQHMLTFSENSEDY